MSAPRADTAGRASPAGLPATAVLRRIARIGPVSRSRLALAAAAGVAAAMATVGLLGGSGYLVGKAAFRPGLGTIAGLLAFVEVLAFVRGPLRYGERLVVHDAAFRALGKWRVWLYDCLEPRSPAGLGTTRSGDLLARAVDDVDTLVDLYVRGVLPFAVALFTSALAVLIVGLVLPPAAIVLGGCLVTALVGAPLASLAARRSIRRHAQDRGELAAEVVDTLQGAAELAAFGRDTSQIARVEQIAGRLHAAARRQALFAGLAQALVTVCLGIAVVGVLTLGVWALRAHRLEPVMLALLPLVAIAAFEPVPPLVAAAARLAEVADAGRRLLALEALPVPVRDPAHPTAVPEGCPPVVVENARLRYSDELPWALDGLSLTAAPGEAVAVMGASGAGKSSLVNALLRFWPLTSGRAALGPVDLTQVRQRDVRRTLALVDQDATVFAGTLRDNVLIGRADAGDDEVRDALLGAHLSDWVDSLPDGLDTQVGEGGSRISGGQRQRLAVARALLAHAPVLVLDEPTSGLDRPVGSALVKDILDAAKSDGRTVVMVTHREDETSGFDRVVTLADGRAVAGGAEPR